MEAGKENPNLTDNWDDAEGYYSKIIILIRNTIKQNLRGHSEVQNISGDSTCIIM